MSAQSKKEALLPSAVYVRFRGVADRNQPKIGSEGEAEKC